MQRVKNREKKNLGKAEVLEIPKQKGLFFLGCSSKGKFKVETLAVSLSSLSEIFFGKSRDF